MADFGELSDTAHSAVAGGHLVMAFQPIVDVPRGGVYAYEALARRPGGTSAVDVFRSLQGRELARMERRLIWEAMATAARLQLPGQLAINLGGTLLGDEAGLEYLVEMAARAGLNPGRIILEFPEHLPIDLGAWTASHRVLRQAGFRTAIDDFGAGYAGLVILATCVPDIIKLDMGLVQRVSEPDQRTRRKVVAHAAELAKALGAEVLAEGVETRQDAEMLLNLGIYLQQGYLHGRPDFMLTGCGQDKSSEVTAVLVP